MDLEEDERGEFSKGVHSIVFFGPKFKLVNSKLRTFSYMYTLTVYAKWT